MNSRAELEPGASWFTSWVPFVGPDSEIHPAAVTLETILGEMFPKCNLHSSHQVLAS